MELPAKTVHENMTMMQDIKFKLRATHKTVSKSESKENKRMEEDREFGVRDIPQSKSSVRSN